MESLEKILFDANDQASAQNWLPLQIDQTSPGVYSGQYREINLPGIKVVTEAQSCLVHKRGFMEENYCTLSFGRKMRPATDPAGPGQSRLSEHLIHTDTLFLISAGTEFDVHVGGNTETTYFRLEQTDFLERIRLLDPQRWEGGTDGLLRFNTPDLQALADLPELLLRRISQEAPGNAQCTAAELSRRIGDQLALALDTALPGDLNGSPTLAARRRAVGQIRAIAESLEDVLDSQSCPTVVDLCRLTGVSQRTLQYSFKHLLGLSPNAYLRIYRLNRARSELLEPASSRVNVTQVATRWHFTHLGKFAGDYTALFSEAPSVTLRRSICQRFGHPVQ
ncbi:helix-turn-helix domain-containing protein [Parahaliea aestuarii]|uniref:Helix-turn-helix domain-containing protein n=1 Tax=Parahaliea aestuarii TaxID=1852021 RepID=A0A5C8ZPF1_9GAMM|nr:helix-turn-helix domain-containing protein [Parahaliea aestuarii]TXS89600.1 helix-turn-helix domain-containing protein [Parahaliea aestuarii]